MLVLVNGHADGWAGRSPGHPHSFGTPRSAGLSAPVGDPGKRCAEFYRQALSGRAAAGGLAAARWGVNTSAHVCSVSVGGLVVCHVTFGVVDGVNGGVEKVGLGGN